MTKQEKELVKKIEAVMARKKIDGNPQDFYSVEKKSTNNYEGTVEVGNIFIIAKGKDIKSTIKQLSKELN